MTNLEKLAKKDKHNSVTTKKGKLTKFTKDAIGNYDISERKFRTHYTSGSGRFTTNLENSRVETILKIMGWKYSKGNDAVRGGKTGNYLKVSKATFNKITALLND